MTEPVRLRGRAIHDQDPLLGSPCDVCGQPLELGQIIIFDEEDGTHAQHEQHPPTFSALPL